MRANKMHELTNKKANQNKKANHTNEKNRTRRKSVRHEEHARYGLRDERYIRKHTAKMRTTPYRTSKRTRQAGERTWRGLSVATDRDERCRIVHRGLTETAAHASSFWFWQKISASSASVQFRIPISSHLLAACMLKLASNTSAPTATATASAQKQHPHTKHDDARTFHASTTTSSKHEITQHAEKEEPSHSQHSRSGRGTTNVRLEIRLEKRKHAKNNVGHRERQSHS